MPRVQLIIMCHKMVIFLSTYRLLSRLVFKHGPSFLRKPNFKSKADALSKGMEHETFSAVVLAGKLTELFSFASFSNTN